MDIHEFMILATVLPKNLPMLNSVEKEIKDRPEVVKKENGEKMLKVGEPASKLQKVFTPSSSSLRQHSLVIWNGLEDGKSWG